MLQANLSQVLRTTQPYFRRLSLMGLKTIKDLLLYFPRTYLDQSHLQRVMEMRINEVSTVRGTLHHLRNERTWRGMVLTQAIFSDQTGSIPVVWFNQSHLTRIFHSGDEVILSGKLKYRLGQLTFQNPSYELVQGKQIHTACIVPLYHEKEFFEKRKKRKISSKWLRGKINPLLKYTSDFDEYLPDWILKKEKLMGYSEAIRQIHFPSSLRSLERARERLGFDELFLLQFQALQKRWRFRKEVVKRKRQIPTNWVLINKFVQTLPFKLTGAQERVIKEILDDLEKPYPMLRLLQGDVGSGKTMVAAVIILNTAKAGFETAIMAPTEILARQHFLTLADLLSKFGLKVNFLVGSTKEKEKEEIRKGLKSGEIDLVIGTHALIQEKIGFKNLGLAVIDEQHRFGVKQRDVLKTYGSPHILSLSATPIPRTLAMTVYGDQDLSILDELPPARQKIITRIVPESKRKAAYEWIKDQIRKGRQVFIICPLIEESEVLQVKAVTKEYQRLKEQVFPEFKLGLLHGRLKPGKKEFIMEKFVQGKLDILVSTSVVEVGIDVPNASIMVIEGAERFGLAQLHQFRGRVGRGEYQSYCFLFTESDSEESQKRFQAVVKYHSGFLLAEIDLILRGPGEIYGVKQSGIPDLKMASLSNVSLLQRARQAAAQLILKDPELINHPTLKIKMEELKKSSFS